MGKSENLLVKFLIALAGITIGVVVILTIIAYQIGVDELEKPNRIAIISGLLSMFGGIAGAFGAYFIAKWQLNVVLDRQYEKEKSKFAWEIKVNKKLEMVQILNNKINDLDGFRKKYLIYNTELNSYLTKRIEQESNIKEIKLLPAFPQKTLKSIDELSDLLFKFKVLFSYESFYSDDFFEKLSNLDKELFVFFKEIVEHLPNKNWEVVSSTNDLLTKWNNENKKIKEKFNKLDDTFYNLIEHLNNEISETLAD